MTDPIIRTTSQLDHGANLVATTREHLGRHHWAVELHIIGEPAIVVASGIQPDESIAIRLATEIAGAVVPVAHEIAGWRRVESMATKASP